MDITFKTNEGKFNYRVGAIIIDNQQLLVMKDEKSPYYYLPGGRVLLNETAENAILREIKEELNIEAKIIRPLWLNQNFFVEDISKEQFHELCLYFLIDINDTNLLTRGNEFITYENTISHKFKWMPFKQLEKERLYPLFIKKEIFNLPQHLTLNIELK